MIVVVKIVLLLIVAFMVVDFALVVVYHKKKKRLSETTGQATSPAFPIKDNDQALNGGKHSRVACNSKND